MDAQSSEYIQVHEELLRWRDVSLCLFFLSHLNLSQTALREVFESNRENILGFLRWGLELDILEYDLIQCVNEFILSSRHFYREKGELDIRKFVVLYHVDNFNVRVGKLVDNVRKLIALPEELGCISSSQLGLVRRVFSEFTSRRPIHTALQDRNQFVHNYREFPMGKEWPLFAPNVRLDETLGADDPDGEAVRWLTDGTAIDTFAMGKVEQLRGALGEIFQLRYSLFRCIGAKIVEGASDEPTNIGITPRGWVKAHLDMLEHFSQS